MVLEPQHLPLPAVSGQAPAAEVAVPAANGDLASHPLPQPGGVLRTGHLAHELVAHDPFKAVITLQNLQVGAADAGQMDAHQDLTFAGFGPGQLFDRRLSVKIEGKHRSYQPSAVGFQPRPRMVKVIVRFSGSALKSYGEFGGPGVSPVHERIAQCALG